MQPILFSIGNLNIFSWGFMLALALMIGTYLSVKKAQKEGLNGEVILDLIIWLVVGGIVGARLFYIFFYSPHYYLNNPLKVFALWEGGLVYYGAFIGGGIALVWFVYKRKLNFWKIADLIAPYLAFGYGIVRIGCFLNGCCYGSETELFWGVNFPHLEGLRHPTQIYSSLAGFLLFIILLTVYRRKTFHGQVLLIYGILYSILRFIIEIYRENLKVIGDITISQLISILLLTVSIILYIKRKNISVKRLNP
jgi:phosphatidylglycerol---prolipoprotein diacylglyceryl transferase